MNKDQISNEIITLWIMFSGNHRTLKEVLIFVEQLMKTYNMTIEQLIEVAYET